MNAVELIDEEIGRHICKFNDIRQITISPSFYKEHKKELKTRIQIVAKAKGNIVNGVKQPKTRYGYYLYRPNSSIPSRMIPCLITDTCSEDHRTL